MILSRAGVGSHSHIHKCLSHKYYASVRLASQSFVEVVSNCCPDVPRCREKQPLHVGPIGGSTTASFVSSQLIFERRCSLVMLTVPETSNSSEHLLRHAGVMLQYVLSLTFTMSEA